jgi:hypothetical protein
MVESRRLLIALLALALMPWLPNAVFAASLPSPVTRTDFDVTRKGNAAAIDFRIKQPRSYVFALEFTYAGLDDENRVLDLVGGWKLHNSGVDIKIRLTLVRLEESAGASSPIFDGEVVTSKSYAHGFSDVKFNGKYRREILTVNLEPGRYRVEATTLDDNPAFAGTPSYLLIDYYAKLQFVPNSLTPNSK